MVVLMTDGRANWTNGNYDETVARNRVLEEAGLCQSADIPVVTISLGVDADRDLMQQVADMCDTTHFNIPGGYGVAEYSQDLLEVFERIAKARPLRLAK